MARGMIPGHPAIGSPVGPWGTCPPPGKGCCGTAAWARHPLAASTRLRYWRKHKRQRRAGGDAAGSEQGGGAQPKLRLEARARNKNTVLNA